MCSRHNICVAVINFCLAQPGEADAATEVVHDIAILGVVDKQVPTVSIIETLITAQHVWLKQSSHNSHFRDDLTSFSQYQVWNFYHLYAELVGLAHI